MAIQASHFFILLQNSEKKRVPYCSLPYIILHNGKITNTHSAIIIIIIQYCVWRHVQNLQNDAPHNAI